MGNKSSKPSQRHHDNSNELEILKAYEKLLLMGFDDKLSFEACQIFKGNLNKAIEYITNKQNDENMGDDCKNDKSAQVTKESTDIYEHKNECDNNSIDKCASIDRMRSLLQIYDNNMNEICNELGEEYSINNIINDYIHIIYIHSNNDDFENMYNKFNIKCNLCECIGLKRNQRDRMNDKKDKNNSINNNCNDRVIMDILDQIHTYLLHTFDIGYRLTKYETNKMNKQEQKDDEMEDNNHIINYSFNKMTNILNQKRKRFDDIIGSQNRINHSKFVTKIDDKEKDHSKKHISHNQNTSNVVYSFSHRFHYWNKSHELSIIRKHKELKDETINNGICSIDINEWNDVQNKANIFIHSDHAKTIKCGDPRKRLLRTYEYTLCDGAPLAINNLIVLILYTDFDTFSYEFSKTFRTENNKESLKELMKRHSNYYWMARYLRETVEGYGDLFGLKSNTKIYYHGISQNMIFSSTIAEFCHPTSTTKQLTVAQRFATNNGMIIKLEHSFGKLAYFDCQWISAFGNEDESLFFGGLRPLQITNIINCSNGNEYKQYLNAMNILIATISNEYCDAASKSDEQIMEYFINSDKRIPSYMLDTFNSYRNHVKCIKINIEFIQESSYLATLFLTNTKNVEQSFVNLKLIGTLFTKCNTIQLYWLSYLGYQPTTISSDYISEVALSLSKYQWDCLQQIEIRNVDVDKKSIANESVDSLINLSQKQFKETTKFNIRYENAKRIKKAIKRLYIERENC